MQHSPAERPVVQGGVLHLVPRRSPLHADPRAGPEHRPPEGRRLDAGGLIRPQDLDSHAVRVIRRLMNHGFTAYLVGGCVRDLLLGRPPKDFDIATDARPRQVKRLFRNSRIIGRRFRLVHITFQDRVLDVSTFRTLADPTPDVEDPLIRQDNQFGEAHEDARRRDFTINGLFYDLHRQEVIDYVGGLQDLERRVVRTIGDPWVRFREDPVRMLRAIKFAGRLDFRLNDDLYKALIDCREDIVKAAAPRVQEEIVRLMDRGGALPSIKLLYKTGLLELLVPEVGESLHALIEDSASTAFWNRLGVVDGLVRSGEEVEAPLLLACLFSASLAAAVYGDGKASPLAPGPLQALLDEVLRPAAQRLRISRRDQYRVRQIYTMQRHFLGAAGGRRRLPPRQLLGRESFPEAFQFFRVNVAATGQGRKELAALEEQLRRLRRAG